MFEKLKGVEHITKVVTLIVKGEEYDCLRIMLILSFKENYYEGVQNSINNSDVVIPRNTHWVPGGVHKPEQLIED